MSANEIIAMIDLYFDDELEKGNEPIMFTILSQNAEGREYFKKLNLLKSGLSGSMEEFPVALDQKILRSIGKLNEKPKMLFTNRKVFSAVTYSITIILLVLTIIFYTRSEDYKVQFADLTREVKEQNNKLELIMNARPAAEVKDGSQPAEQVNVQYADVMRELKRQNDKLELLMNALPPVDVQGSYYMAKQIIVRPNI
ncbi:MAG: hypothetical protein CVV24_09570 [Ignavibacteriae bacterium HGW-Ignavibacteriae-3]|nr:MAG: hypothetical protein CVV24_09570 [Ignavibacteriae bacterium HGW-Ignavibacteriae-3]